MHSLGLSLGLILVKWVWRTLVAQQVFIWCNSKSGNHFPSCLLLSRHTQHELWTDTHYMSVLDKCTQHACHGQTRKMTAAQHDCHRQSQHACQTHAYAPMMTIMGENIMSLA